VVREPFSAIRWLAEAKLVGAARLEAIQRKFSGSSDGKLAALLAVPLHAVLKVRPVREYDPEILELLNNEDLTEDELPWSPLSFCHAYGGMRGFKRARGVDVQRAGQAVLAMIYEGKIPYAIPPPEGDPVKRARVVVAETDDDSDDDVHAEDEDETDDDEVVATRSGFAALALDSDEETAARQYAYSSDEDESGMFISMSDMLAPEDLKESRRGTRGRRAM